MCHHKSGSTVNVRPTENTVPTRNAASTAGKENTLWRTESVAPFAAAANCGAAASDGNEDGCARADIGMPLTAVCAGDGMCASLIVRFAGVHSALSQFASA